jgi:integrase
MIYLLAFGCGLRSGEIKYGRQHWIETGIDGRSVLHIQLEADFDIKDHQSRMVPLEDIILTELRELMPATERGKPDYILSGNATERTDQAFRRFAVWIKKCGLDRIKAAYELRKVYGSLVTQQAGLRAAQELLGHSSYHTTESYYVDQVELPRITIFGKP